MKVPVATYRLQLHHQFNFADAQNIVDYISVLGISDIYASPIFKAVGDSIHGYDIVDPTQINPQLGGKDGFASLMSKVKDKGLGWVQDIVPNHMAFDSSNRLLMDIFESGPRSKFYQFFDVQWDHPYEHLRGKMLTPILGDMYGLCLDKNEIKIFFDENGFSVRVSAQVLPLKIDGYAKILTANLPLLEQNIQRQDEHFIQFLEVIESLKNISELIPYDERYHRISLAKTRLWKLYMGNATIKNYIDGIITSLNGTPGDPASLNRLDELLSEQVFRLSFWKVGNEELNYRRFFTINSLLSLKMERKEVFDLTHELIMQLVKAGDFTGLRVDHVDGLYDPPAYLTRIRQREEDIYIVIEKILDIHEHLPACMPVQGTTGYDFLNVVNGLFVDTHTEKIFDRTYTAFTGLRTPYRDLVSEKKRFFMGKHMAGDIDNLAHLLKHILNRNRYGKDMTMYALRRAIVEVMAQFPVYRAYMCEGQGIEEGRAHIKEAVARAQNLNPGLLHELAYMGKVLLLDFPAEVGVEEKEEYYHFTKKFQQYSGPLMAKAAEDTTFYIYNRFISLNEVGGDPSVFGISPEDFHEFMQERQRRWPLAINATSTHDTKRGEDARARLNVLTEMPEAWEHMVRMWSKINKKKKRSVGALKVPDKNEEYFIYQALVGAYPFDQREHAAFAVRLKDYMIKSLREAKVHTAWINPNTAYEEGCLYFIDALLRPGANNAFLKSFLEFHQKVALPGVGNSLAQVLLKITCPGLPDFYQGSELWDLSFVDPDNRRPVDYERRMELLDKIKGQTGNADFLSDLIKNKEDGRLKFWFTYKMLQFRQVHKELFLKGDYMPLAAKGTGQKHILGFARKLGQTWVVIAVPRFSTQMTDGWQDTALVLPEGAPSQWEHALTGACSHAAGEIQLVQLLQEFPVVVLSAKEAPKM